MSEENPQIVRATVQISLQVGLLIGLANIVCVVIFSWAILHYRKEPNSLSVTGSAKRTIRSDLIVWKTAVTARSESLPGAYDALKTSVDRTTAYLKTHGVADAETKASAIAIERQMATDINGTKSDKIIGYELTETVEVTSIRVDDVAATARDVTGLIKDGVELTSQAPAYYYTKLADLKVAMLADATRDATARANQIAENSGARLGTLSEARMGVMQVNPLHSSEASGEGNNDTTSLEKDVIAIVSAKFELR